jgi:cell division protein FtsQ
MALGYLAARETAMFAVRTLEIEGASRAVAADIREALRDTEGQSLVALDPGEVEARIERIPAVRFASVDRSFPHKLSVLIVSEKPLALLRVGDQGWIVSADGRVLREVEPRAHPRLPRIRLPQGTPLEPGARLRHPDARRPLALLAALSPSFPARPLAAESKSGELSLVVDGWVRIRLGDANRLEQKLAAAAAVLRSLSSEERAGLSYLDASVPERVVAGPKSQPVSESLEFGLEDPENKGFDTPENGA